MSKDNGKQNMTVILGAAFLMATSAIGPGFLTQSATFTSSLDALAKATGYLIQTFNPSPRGIVLFFDLAVIVMSSNEIV